MSRTEFWVRFEQSLTESRKGKLTSFLKFQDFPVSLPMSNTNLDTQERQLNWCHHAGRVCHGNWQPNDHSTKTFSDLMVHATSMQRYDLVWCQLENQNRRCITSTAHAQSPCVQPVSLRVAGSSSGSPSRQVSFATMSTIALESMHLGQHREDLTLLKRLDAVGNRALARGLHCNHGKERLFPSWKMVSHCGLQSILSSWIWLFGLYDKFHKQVPSWDSFGSRLLVAYEYLKRWGVGLKAPHSWQN